MSVKKLFSVNKKITLRGREIPVVRHCKILSDYGLSNINQYYENVERPDLLETFNTKAMRKEKQIKDACDNMVEVEIKITDIKETLDDSDRFPWDEDGYSTDQSNIMLYHFHYTISILSSIDSNLLKMKYPNLFQNNFRALKELCYGSRSPTFLTNWYY